MQTENEGTLAQLSKVHGGTKGGEKFSVEEGVELPSGGKVAEENEPVIEASAEEVVNPPAPAPVTEIKIGDQIFTNQADAIKYAETLAHEKLVNESYNMGMREAMRANAPAEPVVEENFEEKFYSDPKGTLKNIEETAVQKALNSFRAEQNRENLWKTFFNENPDLEGHREICEHTLQKNWDILGNMTDIKKAMGILATKTRSVFESYNEAKKPRTEMPRKSSQAVSTGSSAQGSVTPKQKEERVLTMAEQMRKLSKR